MSSQFSVCTYNLGSGVNDYYFLCQYLNPSLKLTSAEEEDAFYTKYAAIQQKTTDLLINHADVYCLQEVVNTERPMIKSLQDKGFEVVYLKELLSFDTAIALNTKRFKDISNHSIDIQITKHFKKDVAIATATDIQSGQRVAFASLHAPGFNLTKINVEDTAAGDLYCRKIAEKLSEISGCAIHVVGADMNANPEKWNPRFQIFSNKGFRLLRTNSSTNVNTQDEVYREREIDFIFVRNTSSVWQKIAAIFFRNIQCIATFNPLKPIGWNAEANASDHLPVFINVSLVVANSLIYQLWSFVYRYFVSKEPKSATSS